MSSKKPAQKEPIVQERKRGESLITAHSIINGERQAMYGQPEDNLTAIATLWTWWLKHKNMVVNIDGFDVAMMMSLMKFARIATGFGKSDSFIDAEAYIALAMDEYKRLNITKMEPR